MPGPLSREPSMFSITIITVWHEILIRGQNTRHYRFVIIRNAATEKTLTLTVSWHPQRPPEKVGCV
ncbi:MAG: hypothetical protein ACJ70Q_08105 [Nitrososphaera sp.]